MALADIARSLEENINRRGIVKRRRSGWLPQIVPFSGYGSTTAVKILARAMMADPSLGQPPFDLDFLRGRSYKSPAINAVRDIAELALETGVEAQRGWRQFFTTQVGFLPVTVVIGDRRIKTRTDRNGYVDLLVENHGLTPGWHEVELIPAAGKAVKAPVMIVSPNATQGLVSDIDDTIMVTWLPRVALAAWNSFVVHTNSRKTVVGMSDFYRNILEDHPDAPVFYLSTGAWNTYSTLQRFLDTFRFPIGPLLMTDWGPTPTGLFRSGQEHKKTQLRNLLIMFPNIEWILVGDDGQHDPLIYDELAREHPSRVNFIALRELNPVEQVLSHGTLDPAESIREDSDIERHGVPVIRGRDGHELLLKFKHLFSKRQ
ncbi:App1 family protein [Arcanobacterium ihumii]|uniref:App1 family protein n=1 Tax=Arcanobacterium ihumii TaxID=2138162 RepID=UPI000F525B4E|nr:phosphatase domain-containing protein [Arcanobacterium ihumii]